MSRRTIVLGVNQTIMAALSMVTIAALIDAPGLGKAVIKALQSLDVGIAFNAGLAIVIMAIVLDRDTTAASQRAERAGAAGRPARSPAHRRPLIVGGRAGHPGLRVAVLHLRVGRGVPRQPGLAQPRPGQRDRQGRRLGEHWAQTNLSAAHRRRSRTASPAGLLDPVAGPARPSRRGGWWSRSPCWRSARCSAAGGPPSPRRVCLAVIIGTGLWSDSMATLAVDPGRDRDRDARSAVVVGVWMGRSARADRVIRPVLDAAQTMPAFVYLVPFLALFAASRFTGDRGRGRVRRAGRHQDHRRRDPRGVRRPRSRPPRRPARTAGS